MYARGWRGDAVRCTERKGPEIVPRALGQGLGSVGPKRDLWHCDPENKIQRIPPV